MQLVYQTTERESETALKSVEAARRMPIWKLIRNGND